MIKNYQQGFAPIILIVLLAIVGGASFFIIKNILFNQPDIQSKPITQSSNSAQVKTSPTPTPIQSGLTTTKISSKTTPSPASAKQSPTPTNKPSDSNNSPTPTSSPNSSSQPTPTNTPVPTTIPTSTPTPTPSSIVTTNNGITTSVSCSGSTMRLSAYGDIPSPSNRSNGLYSALVDTTTNQTMVYEYDGNQGPPTIHISANFPPTGPINGSTNVPLVADGRTYAIKVYESPFQSGVPTVSGNPVAQTTFSKTCP